MSAAPISRLVAVLGLLTLLAVALPLSAAPMKWTLGGYLQARLTEDLGTPASGASTPSTFSDTRPSILVRATDDKPLFLQFFFSKPAGDTLEVQHAFAEYRAAPYAARLGLMPVPFGYENPVTSSALITTERSRASQAMIGPFGIDRGFTATYRNPNGLNLAAGVFNGQPYTVSRDDNSDKVIAARAGYTLKNGEIGLSYYTGDAPGATAPADVDRFGLDAMFKLSNVTILAEYFTGEGDLITETPTNFVVDDGKGGYLTVAYRKPGTAFMPYIRFDTLDPQDNVDGDSFNRITGGVSYYLNETSKIQLEFESINDDLNPDLDGRYTAQYQIIF